MRVSGNHFDPFGLNGAVHQRLDSLVERGDKTESELRHAARICPVIGNQTLPSRLAMGLQMVSDSRVSLLFVISIDGPNVVEQFHAAESVLARLLLQVW